MTMRLDGQVAIVTGSGRGLGRCHALALAERGAQVLVNDLAHGDRQTGNADAVVEEILRKGGKAESNGANVSDFAQVEAMVAQAMEKWGRVDILVNNAGILRDRTFAKMSVEEMRQVIDVHLLGSMFCAKAVWEQMRDQSYGRIIFTTSSSGLYGNFGQTNYGAAKMAMVGMMNTLHLEGAKHNIHVNCLAPTAGTEMTKGIFPDAVFGLLSPETVSPGIVFLASKNAPSRKVLAAGGGSFSIFKGFETEGVNLQPNNLSAEEIAEHWNKIDSQNGMRELQSGGEQTTKFAMQAASSLGVDLSQ